jgi:hypothetical protein
MTWLLTSPAHLRCPGSLFLVLIAMQVLVDSYSLLCLPWRLLACGYLRALWFGVGSDAKYHQWV